MDGLNPLRTSWQLVYQPVFMGLHLSQLIRSAFCPSKHNHATNWIVLPLSKELKLSRVCVRENPFLSKRPRYLSGLKDQLQAVKATRLWPPAWHTPQAATWEAR